MLCTGEVYCLVEERICGYAIVGITISCGVRGRPQQGKGLEVPCNYVLHVSEKKRLLKKSTLRISKSDDAINVCVVQCYILACIAV